MRSVIKLALLLISGSTAPGQEAGKRMLEGVSYRLFRTTPEKLELHWKDAAGAPYAQFSRLQSALLAKGRKIHFMMNAGIFYPGGVSSGHLPSAYRHHK